MFLAGGVFYAFTCAFTFHERFHTYGIPNDWNKSNSMFDLFQSFWNAIGMKMLMKSEINNSVIMTSGWAYCNCFYLIIGVCFTRQYYFIFNSVCYLVFFVFVCENFLEISVTLYFILSFTHFTCTYCSSNSKWCISTWSILNKNNVINPNLLLKE